MRCMEVPTDSRPHRVHPHPKPKELRATISAIRMHLPTLVDSLKGAVNYNLEVQVDLQIARRHPTDLGDLLAN